jgi:lipid-A-disaccharide synthase
MRIFVSAGEPSGDLHGGNLVRELSRLHPGVEYVGFGGPNMQAAGCRLLYPLADNPIMGFVKAIASVPHFWRRLQDADRCFRDERPDAVVIIDMPGFHWHLAKAAKARGIPVYYFMPPQMWGWAGWRVKKMRRSVDHALCSLTFEQRWYADRGVNAHYVGHPYFDELSRQRLDENFLVAERADTRPIIALLPGSRTVEVELNFATQIEAAHRIHARRPDVRFLVASFKESQRALALKQIARYPGLPIQTHVGRTAEIIELSHSCIAVSGSVSLELLYRRRPTVVVYRTNPLYLWITHRLKTVPYITLVNLLADAELFPEFLSSRNEAVGAAGHVLNWLDDPASHQVLVDKLTNLKTQVAQPGACARTAEYILQTVGGPRAARRVA